MASVQTAPSGLITNVADPYRPLTEAERNAVVLPSDPWTDQYAVTVVKSNTEEGERFLSSAGHYTRWTAADEQFVGWRAQQLWEGTRKPKARVPVFLLFSQLEALLPNVLSAMFPLHENIDVAPRPGSDLENAHAAWELIMAQLDSLGEAGLTRFRTIAHEVFYQAFLYGNGIVELTWLFKEIKKRVYEAYFEITGYRPQTDEITGQITQVPNDDPKRRIRERTRTIRINQPNIECVDIRDFLIDPNCTSPDIEKASWCARRHLMTVGQLLELGTSNQGFTMPNAASLIHMARQRNQTQSDTAKQQSTSVQGRPFNTSDNMNGNPYDLRVEVIRWFSRDRNVWLLNREWVGFNKPNPYGFKPFLNAFYVPFPNRFHGMSLADVVEGEQHLQASMLEARLNELSLALSAPFVRKNGSMIGGGGTIPMSPAKVIDVNDDPEKAIKRLEVNAITQPLFMEVADSERRAAKTTGLSDMAVMGQANAAGNSANRTAAGISAQTSAAGTRIQFLVENAQASLFEPLCMTLHQFNRMFIPREQMIDILGVDGKQKTIDPISVLNADPRFTMRAAARMRARQQLVQILPWLVQTLMNPELLSMVGDQQQMTLNIKALIDLIMDTLNAPKIDLFRPLSQQELQAKSQPSPDVQMEMQKQQARLDAAMQMAQQKGDTELMKVLMGKIITPRAAEDMLGFSDTQQHQSHAQLIEAAMRGMGHSRPPLMSRMLLAPPTPEMGQGADQGVM
jgi:hypothetical protein